ncbi:methyltransferase domain-containing protein [Arenimonas sp. MALMAid1274]|uniref:class I SAM-dependent methyltransferase n=1 Tax=Arenimonas sp. MALMAid1274 TaxID=3411630 RepID=UPI003BA11618
MSPPDDSARRTAWSEYWATGGLHSCVGSFDSDYSGAIGQFWQRVFGELPAGARQILDLATGNGALPRLAWQRLGGEPGLSVDAVDLATVAPTWVPEAARKLLRFHSGVSMERLPFADASFDLVTSQYGFEYAQRGPAGAEALRVLKPTGRLALVMHHAESVLVRVGRSELSHQQALLAPDGLLSALGAVAPWFSRARAGEDLSGNADASAARAAYNAAARRVQQRAATQSAPDLLLEALAWAQGVLARIGTDPAPAGAAIDAYRATLAAAGLRTAELIGHALDAHEAEALVLALKTQRPGSDIHCQPLQQAEGVLGWALELRPRA